MVAIEESDEDLIARAGVALPPEANVTPMLRQWLRAKAKAPDAILLFRMGDFYELFGPDADDAGPLLDLVVTTRDRDKSSTSAISMAGFPHHAAPAYIARLVERGRKVAVCDQLEDPALARGIVKRDVTRLVTPGMVLDDESLDANANNFLVTVSGPIDRAGVCAIDLSTGTFVAATIDNEAGLIDEIQRLAPAELVVVDDGQFSKALIERFKDPDVLRTVRRVEVRPAPGKNLVLLKSLCGAADPLLDEKRARAARVACEVCLTYVVEAQGKLPTHFQSPRAYSIERALLLDDTTRRHLSIVGGRGETRAPGTLAHVVDKTLTAPGARQLLGYLTAPSADLAVIRARHDIVGAFVDDPECRRRTREALKGMYDVERLVGRIAAGRAGPRELKQLGLTLTRVPALVDALRKSENDVLVNVADGVLVDDKVAIMLSAALVDDPALQIGQGPIFRRHYNDDLDRLMDLASGGRDEIAAMEEHERQRTGIPNLKVKHTRVFGFYLEVTKTHLKKVPDDWKRKQTVANAERFVTEDLARLEEQVANAEKLRDAHERELLDALLSSVNDESHRLRALAEMTATVDALLAFAETSAENRYTRPLLSSADARALFLKGARHPVVEHALRQRGEAFVPCDLVLTGDDRQLVVVTGPNMAGKSTLMRQVALIQILAQAGCFVPATRAELSLCDRVFTRVGASDDLAQGRSTFMVEMTETSHILKNATKHSLVLLDEIGRGTATFDGLSLAWAVGEHIHDHVGARTLFATHYHELCDLADALPRVFNIHVVVKEWNDRIVFTRTIADGGAERSYGIQVARLAGLPAGLLSRAREILAALEGDVVVVDDGATRAGPRPHRRKKGPEDQMSLFGGGKEPAEAHPFERFMKELVGIDTHRTTPLDALNRLDALAKEARRLMKDDDKTDD